MANRSLKNNGKFGILFVCTGNICRSPMAAGVLKSLLPGEYANLVHVGSAGIGALPAFPASDHAISVCAEENIDITDHRSRQVSREILDRSQIVFSLSKNHYDFLRLHYPEYQENGFLLKRFDRKKRRPAGWSVADPIGEDKNFYKKVYREIKREIKRILPRLLQLVDLYYEKLNAGDEQVNPEKGD